MARIAIAEDELRAALVTLKKDNPTLGVVKTHTLLLEINPSWAVSEKRVRKILQSEGLVVTEKDNGSTNDAVLTIHPTSRLNKSLDVNKWCSKVKVHHFNAVKGKGLVATEEISEGEVLWREDPFVLAPEWDIYDLQKSSKACAFCSTPMGDHSPLHLPCQASTSATPCSAMFCNRLCRMQSEKVHPLLCSARNPASIPLLKFARTTQWLALHALAQCTSKLLLSNQRDDGSVHDDLQVVQGLAEMGMEERFKALRDKGVEPDRENWKKGYGLYLQAFKAPKSIDEQKKFARILKKAVSETIEKDLFEYDAFLRGLGRMSLNIEAHGGVYKLHSHLNHSCTPNISVRHFDQRSALARITVFATTAIKPGEEFLITYVDPRSNYKERRRRLLEWGFGPCRCVRCLAEEKEEQVSGRDTEEGDDLAEQLRAGFGLV
ncbi:SET domain-containing protein [Gyrodon lividus]|nr:SET domain-containing protein [Gyrodon lividus]